MIRINRELVEQEQYEFDQYGESIVDIIEYTDYDDCGFDDFYWDDDEDEEDGDGF